MNDPQQCQRVGVPNLDGVVEARAGEIATVGAVGDVGNAFRMVGEHGVHVTRADVRDGDRAVPRGDCDAPRVRAEGDPGKFAADLERLADAPPAGSVEDADLAAERACRDQLPIGAEREATPAKVATCLAESPDAAGAHVDERE